MLQQKSLITILYVYLKALFNRVTLHGVTGEVGRQTIIFFSFELCHAMLSRRTCSKLVQVMAVSLIDGPDLC